MFLNPAFVTRVKDSPSLDLADKLNTSTGETSQYPRSLTGKQTIDGTKTQLTAKQLFDLKKSVGLNSDKIFKQFNDNPIFQSKTDEDKVKALSGALTDINSAGKATIAAKNNLGQFAPDYNGKAKKLSTGAQKIVTGDYDVTSKLIGQDLPKNMNKEAVNVLASYDKAKAKEANTNQTVKNTLKTWNNGKDVPVTNEVDKQWAEYEKKAAEGTLGKLEAVDEKKKILRNAYNSTLNEDEKDLYKLSKTRLKEAYDQGLITDANIQKALDAENKLYEAGLIDKKSLHGKLGLATGAKTSGRSGRSSRSGRSGGRKSTKKVAKLDLSSFSTYKSKRSSTNASLRKLLGSAKV